MVYELYFHKAVKMKKQRIFFAQGLALEGQEGVPAVGASAESIRQRRGWKGVPSLNPATLAPNGCSEVRRLWQSGSWMLLLGSL